MSFPRRVYWAIVKLPYIGRYMKRAGDLLRSRMRAGVRDDVSQMVELHNHMLYAISDNVLSVGAQVELGRDVQRRLDELEALIALLESALGQLRDRVEAIPPHETHLAEYHSEPN